MVPFHFLPLRAAINTSQPAYSSALTSDQERRGGRSPSQALLEEKMCTLFQEANPKVAVRRASSVPDNLRGSFLKAGFVERAGASQCRGEPANCFLLEYNNPEIWPAGCKLHCPHSMDFSFCGCAPLADTGLKSQMSAAA